MSPAASSTSSAAAAASTAAQPSSTSTAATSPDKKVTVPSEPSEKPSSVPTSATKDDSASSAPEKAVVTKDSTSAAPAAESTKEDDEADDGASTAPKRTNNDVEGKEGSEDDTSNKKQKSSDAVPEEDAEEETGAGDIEEDPEMNMDMFNQILEMDEDPDNREFSHEIVFNFFDQAHVTLKDMETSIPRKDLDHLAHLGHFLKGSSAALGLVRVQKLCEDMQHYGQLRDEEADRNLQPEEALGMIGKLMKELKVEYAKAERWLKAFFAEENA